MQGEIKINSRRKRSEGVVAGETLTGRSLPNHEDPSEVSTPNGHAPVRLFTPYQE